MRRTSDSQFRADPGFLIEPFEPAYLALARTGVLPDRAAAARRELEDCCECPRNCHVNRWAGETRVCGTGRYARISSAFPHLGEENCLRGWNGSGTIFFSLCNLRCVFCQNWDISQQPSGEEYTAEEIAGMMLALQRRGCHNINFVTPEHVVPQVIEAIVAAVSGGLRLPIVYNTFNILGQYRPAYEVGRIARDGEPQYADINRRPTPEELAAAYRAAREAGLWRFDKR